MRDWWDRYQKGEKLADIARPVGTTPENLLYFFRKHGLVSGRRKTCKLKECGEEFSVRGGHKEFCSHAHLKRHKMREDKGMDVSLLPCVLPECSEKVWAHHKKGERPKVGANNGLWCSRSHGDLHHKRRRTGFYGRLLGSTEECSAPGCSEQLVLDIHHEEFTGTKSNKDSPEHLLCPTHHMKIHRGMARIEDGRYIHMEDELLEGMSRKSRLFDNYYGEEPTKRLKGMSWQDAK